MNTHNSKVLENAFVMRSFVKGGMGIDKVVPAAPQVVSHNVDSVHLFAQLLNIVASVEPGLFRWYCHRYLPVLRLVIECYAKFLYEFQEILFVRGFASFIRISWVFPVQVESVEIVVIHVLCQTLGI